MANLPSGTVTFLFTDIEGSTSIAQQRAAAWEHMRSRHDAILRSTIKAHGGHVFQFVGDACCAAFDTPRAGLDAAVAIQRALQAEPWEDHPVRVRVGLHTGEARPVAGDYAGYLTLTRVQRLMSAAHGDQILLSNSSAELVRAELADDTELRDLGLHRLRGLRGDEHIWQLIAPGLRHDFPPIQSVGTIPNNLPAQLTSFVGREKELEDLQELLRSHRLVTLTGAGGTGKTRLSLEVAAAALTDFKDGVWFIELAPLSDPALMPNAVASVLEVHEEPGRALMKTVLEWLEGRELLLVLDNCEHLIGACARFTDAVLRSDRGSKILVTSREPLGISGEMAYHVPSLESPEPAQTPRMPIQELTRFAAVRLFSERAREAVTTFDLTEANADDVVQICHRLDGIPLAIELAAARLKVLGVAQIAARLDDRFRLLTGGGRVALPRHQTLRSLIDWSYGLLSNPERVLLARLAAFAGGWTLDAAEQVCSGSGIRSSDILDLLTLLVDKSLISASTSSSASRYGMLETIRQYALEKLIDSDEAAQVRAKHLDFVLGIVKVGTLDSLLSNQSRWYDQMELELDNVRAALEWALRLKDCEPALKLAGGLHWFWYTRAHWHEGHRWLQEALARAAGAQASQGRAWALTALGFFEISVGNYATGQNLLEQAASTCRQIGDRRSLVHALAWHGSFAGLWADFVGASRVLQEALQLARELDDKLGMGLSLMGLGNLHAIEGNDAESEACNLQASRFLAEAGDKIMLPFVRRRLGYVALRRGDFSQALALCRESLNLNLEIRDMRGVAASMAAFACIAASEQDLSRAAQLYGASQALLTSRSEQLTPVDLAEIQPFLRSARERLGEDQYDRLFSQGLGMKTEEGIAYALQQSSD